MPSLLHEGLILLVRDRPELAAKILVDLLGVEVPRFTEARLTEAALPEIVPVEYFADAIVRGRGLSLATMNSTIAADMSTSKWDSIAVDTVSVRTRIANGLSLGPSAW